MSAATQRRPRVGRPAGVWAGPERAGRGWRAHRRVMVACLGDGATNGRGIRGCHAVNEMTVNEPKRERLIDHIQETLKEVNLLHDRKISCKCKMIVK